MKNATAELIVCPSRCTDHYETPALAETVADGIVFRSGPNATHYADEFSSVVGPVRIAAYVMFDGEAAEDPSPRITLPDIRHRPGTSLDDHHEVNAAQARSYAAALLAAADELDRITSEVQA